ncbi:MAG: twin-arginine translocase TatA/TatE family subunit [Verrucomicrobia bacterium]|nr:twin-arginine translocase TatA/TatE family subunit [Verrucomicrobiota bacterium]
MASLPFFPLAFMGMGPTELIVILIILLVLFGGSKLPGLAKGLGQSIKEFKKATKEEPEAEKPAAAVAEAPKPAAAATTAKPPAAS